MKTIPAPTCHHTFPDDHRCGSPSLRGEAFCYFHHPNRPPAPMLPKSTATSLPRRATLTRKSPGCKRLHCPFLHKRRARCPLTPIP